MHFDRPALEQALEGVTQISGPDRFCELTRLAAPGVSALSLEAAAGVTLAMLLPDMTAGDALAVADAPLTTVSVHPLGSVENRLEPEDVAEHPLSDVIRPTLRATIARRLRAGAAREDLLPQEIVGQILEVTQGAPGQIWTTLGFRYATTGTEGVATFGVQQLHPVIRRTDVAAVSLDRVGALAYAFTLARGEPAQEEAPAPPAPSSAATVGTVH